MVTMGNVSMAAAIVDPHVSPLLAGALMPARRFEQQETGRSDRTRGPIVVGADAFQGRALSAAAMAGSMVSATTIDAYVPGVPPRGDPD